MCQIDRIVVLPIMRTRSEIVTWYVMMGATGR